MPRPIRSCTSILAAALAVAAAPSTSAAPDAEALDRGAEIAYRRVLAPAAETKQLNADASTMARVRGIANRLVVAAGVVAPESKRYAWTMNVVADPASDVRVYPGGRVVVSDGLIAKTGFGDAELAAVLANAFAHAVLGHDTSRIVKSLGPRADSPDPNRQALDVAEATAASMRSIRYDAAEIAAADRLSVEMLARAAYDPRAAGSAWRRLGLGSKGIVERAPVSDARLAALDATIRAAVPLYDETRGRAEEQARRQRPPLISGPKGGPPVR